MDETSNRFKEIPLSEFITILEAISARDWGRILELEEQFVKRHNLLVWVDLLLYRLLPFLSGEELEWVRNCWNHSKDKDDNVLGAHIQEVRASLTNMRLNVHVIVEDLGCIKSNLEEIKCDIGYTKQSLQEIKQMFFARDEKLDEIIKLLKS